jgi:plasmid stability protein
MATLYVDNVPDDLYEALRSRAREHRRSVAAEVLALLEENIPIAAELKRRQQFFRQAQRLRSQRPRGSDSLRSTEEMLREDRVR